MGSVASPLNYWQNLNQIWPYQEFNILESKFYNVKTFLKIISTVIIAFPIVTPESMIYLSLSNESVNQFNLLSAGVSG